MISRYTKLDNWVKEIIVDPLSKEPLTINNENTFLISPYGRKYPICNGVYDLRLLNNNITSDQKSWREGQLFYERWSTRIASNDDKQNYIAGIENVKDVYDEIPVDGNCLDVGGHQGRLRHFLSEGQEYVVCDPFLNGFDDLEKQPNLLRAYPCLQKPVNFICCDAEFLPFMSEKFQSVHMRSVIDHLLSPELALNEAYRVLKPNGALIVGLFVDGGKLGKTKTRSFIKGIIRKKLASIGFRRFKDYHIWHPTYRELIKLILDCGFKIEKTHWQKGYDETVCYILAKKNFGLTRSQN